MTAARFKELGFEELTDWTFSEPFPLTGLLKEGQRLLRYYEKKGYTRLVLQFAGERRLYLWGKKENDYEI